MNPEIPTDIARLIGNHIRMFVLFFLSVIKPPSNEPIWKWAEQNIELSSATSSIPGKIRYDLFPASKIFFAHVQNPLTRKITTMAGAQSAKTEDVITVVLWRVVENPTPTMWAMADGDMCEDFAKDRLFPAFRNCAPAFALAPKDRKLWTKRFVKLDTMTLHLRGSRSKAKLQSSPIGLIICDERREWKHGAINTIRKRMQTFDDCQEISMGVAGVKNDELHTDFLDGSQTFIHFTCLKCSHSQPFRFGRDATALFTEARNRGGLVWPTNEITKPNGKWDYEAVERDVRLECENCGHLYHNNEKSELLKTVHEHHRNSKALPRHASLHRNTLMMPWSECDWGKIAVRFLKAAQALKFGDIEPMKTFVTEDLGEPWEMPQDRKQREGILRCQTNYKLGEYWTDPSDKSKLAPQTVFILTADRQLHYLRYVVRQWRADGSSRLVHVGKVASLEDLRALQHELKIRDACVWIDARGKKVSEVRQKAMVWNWNLLQGEAEEHFLITDGDRKYRQGWRETQLDPGIGTQLEGRATMRAFLWSNSWFKDKLYFLFIPGQGPLWEIAADSPADYIAEVSANEWREKEKSDGSIEGFFYEADVDDCADCELYQLVAADIGGLTRRYSAK